MKLKERVPVKEQPAAERIRNFGEVSLGYSEEEAWLEASRCTKCGKCVPGCPVQIDISGFIQLIKEKKYPEALDKIKLTNSLPGICGRVCPQETQCEALCPLGKKGQPVNIGKLERFAADFGISNSTLCAKPDDTTASFLRKQEFLTKSDNPESQKPKVAVAGSGPAGLTCAGELAKKGFDVTVFESLHSPGGVLRYGIPEFRLPRKILDAEINCLKTIGVKITPNVLLGKTLTVSDLKEEGFRAIFLSVGAGLPLFLNIPGENFNGVLSANEFLTRINLMRANLFPKESDTPVRAKSPVIVVGGGNVAMDSARSAKRLGAEKVILIYRRTEKEMPARIEEIHHANEEGIEFHYLAAPVEIVADKNGRVSGAKCIRMELGPVDSSGRRSPVMLSGSEYFLEAGTIIVAVGTRPNPVIFDCIPELKKNPRGTVVTDENLMTSVPGIFAGGDIVTGAATVISAMAMGKKAAISIDNYIINR